MNSAPGTREWIAYSGPVARRDQILSASGLVFSRVAHASSQSEHLNAPCLPPADEVAGSPQHASGRNREQGPSKTGAKSHDFQPPKTASPSGVAPEWNGASLWL